MLLVLAAAFILSMIIYGWGATEIDPLVGVILAGLALIFLAIIPIKIFLIVLRGLGFLTPLLMIFPSGSVRQGIVGRHVIIRPDPQGHSLPLQVIFASKTPTWANLREADQIEVRGFYRRGNFYVCRYRVQILR